MTHQPEGPSAPVAGGPDLRDAGFITELIGLTTFLEQQETLEDSLRQLAAMAAHLLRTRNCSIMLLKEDGSEGEVRLRVCSHFGHLPEAAYRESVSLNEGIAGQVASRNRPLLIENIDDSPFAGQARRRSTPGGFVSVPIALDDHVIGVLNISDPEDGRRLNQADLNLTTLVALMVGKSIQVFQLKHLLRSNFIQLAVARETRGTPASAVDQIAQNGPQMARILAKTFFREMRDAGFGSDHILTAATEIISLLSADLNQRHQDDQPPDSR